MYKGVDGKMVMKELIMPLATGLAVFLFGMQVMRLGFEKLFLHRVKRWLEKLTRTPFTGLLTGLVVAALLQSSSAVMLLVIGLAHGGLLTFRHTLGIILGANIGTVVTTELIALKWDDLALLFFLGGALLFLFSKAKIKRAGMVIGGFGLLLIGMDIMQTATLFFKQSFWAEKAQYWMEQGAVYAIWAGTMLTAIIQSSTVSTALTMNLFANGLLSLDTAIGLVLGSNIGTCATALIGSIAANVTGRKVAIAHLIFNVIGVLLFIPLIPLLGSVVMILSDQPAVQVAHAQTLFNVVTSVAALPFIPLWERLVNWVAIKAHLQE